MPVNYFAAVPSSSSAIISPPTATVQPFDRLEEEDNLTLSTVEIFTRLYDISELTWLNVANNTEPSIMLNATNKVYQVLMNTVS